jgi:capsular polysaccharide biosynthesis protein
MEELMEETISLKEFLQTLRKRLAMIFAITLLAVIISGAVSYFYLTPIYQASTQLLVNQSKNEQMQSNFTEVQTNLQLINTYNVIIKSPAILDLVIEELDLKMTTDQLNGKISVQSEKDSQVVNISVLDADPVQAVEIANKTAEVFTKEIVDIMNVDNVSILAKAVMDNQAPIKPRPLVNMVIGLAVGLLVSIGLAFLLEYLDNKVRNEQDVEKKLGLPLLGVIATINHSHVENKEMHGYVAKSEVRGESVGS